VLTIHGSNSPTLPDSRFVSKTFFYQIDLDITPTTLFASCRTRISPTNESTLPKELLTIYKFLCSCPLELYMLILSFTLDMTVPHICSCSSTHLPDATRTRNYIYYNILPTQSAYSNDHFHRSFGITTDWTHPANTVFSTTSIDSTTIIYDDNIHFF